MLLLHLWRLRNFDSTQHPYDTTAATKFFFLDRGKRRPCGVFLRIFGCSNSDLVVVGWGLHAHTESDVSALKVVMASLSANSLLTQTNWQPIAFSRLPWRVFAVLCVALCGVLSTLLMQVALLLWWVRSSGVSSRRSSGVARTEDKECQTVIPLGSHLFFRQD